ncbi:enoyl-CoA hydratase/isomerase family protein [Methylobacterium sp. E-066]|uniref:enoyl-CoA hydratase/isomerase family protein n=1 Tax=Methylobacterium sp. E-066 TaxID=2836584 RepID=UPI001FB92498|nr:enoyl-CoA hydratase/isomerase family protein [Methylobacterium sp. E-066]MCJ2139859.1 enoyl-CoA hydratase/isomerase family protein [Methylobacterium sp. E-066]
MTKLILETMDTRGVATLTLNRPDRHNAFDDVLIADLAAALRRLGDDPGIRAVVLASSGRSFSAGADLEWMRRIARQSPDANRADAAGLARLMHILDRLPKPTLTLVQGAAYGGGVGLVACCDVAIASERASFCLSEVKLGLTPATISPYVVNAVGPRWARRLFQTAEVVSAVQAREIGLVHEVVPEDGLAAACETVLQATLQGAPGAQADAKDLVFLCEGRPIDADLMGETGRRIALRRASAEGQEGIAAFLGKRLPAWRQE